MVVVKMIIGNDSWMTNAELLNEVTVVNSKLLNHGIHLGFSMDDTKRHHVTLKVVSSYDDGIFIVDDKSINTVTNSFVNTMKNRLRIIANRAEFLAFVVESVSKMKELDEHLLVGNMIFKCSRKTDDGEVIFVFERGIYAFGGGTFSYHKAINCVELILDIEDLDTEVTSVDIEDLPKELKTPNIVKKHYDLGIQLGVKGTPSIVTSTGEMLGGYLKPQDLLAVLQESAQ